MKKQIYSVAIVFMLVLAGVGAQWWLLNTYQQNLTINLENRLADFEKQMLSHGGKVSGEMQTQSNLPEKEVVNRQVVHEKSQDELLTSAVSGVAPAVVSIVISKDVPQLEVVYGNPFGDDPFFKDFGIQVPMYRQKGVSKQQIGAGTGFFITQDGYILTNRHVVEDKQADYTVLLSNGGQKPASVVYRDAVNDFAIVKIEGKNYSKVSLGNSDSLKLGQTVVAIGNALGQYSNSVSVGIISGLNRAITASGAGGSENLNGVIQTDAAINPGNSGGPLFGLDGKVVGVNVATVAGSSNISFSIPVNQILSSIKNVVRSF